MTRDIIRKEEGAIAVEYVLLIILVALGILAGGVYFATQVSGKYNETGDAVTGTTVSPLG